MGRTAHFKHCHLFIHVRLFIRRHAIRLFPTSFSRAVPPYASSPRLSSIRRPTIRFFPTSFSRAVPPYASSILPIGGGTERSDTNILSATPDLPTTGGELHAVKRTGR